ncbi:MAG TPA: phage tail tape measure protein, partial [Acidimicrobiia bacterium]
MAGRSFVINLLGNAKPAVSAFGKVGKAAGRLPGPVGIATAAITASFAAVVAAVGKVGKELVELGEEFNDAYRTIQVGTGAVGDDLEDLRQSFRDVVREVPSEFGQVATAIAEVSTRTGLTGDDLEALSEQFLNLSRLTGGDVVSDIRGATRMFNRFGVDAEDTGDMLDFLFRVSQATGIGIEKLGKNTTDYGAQLKNMGLSLEEAVVFMGLLEREGASVTRIMPSLNTAAMKLKAEGFDNVNEGLAFFIDELRTLDDDAAESRAMEILGSQYKNFLDVVRDNNIDYGELVERLQDSQVTINETAEETDGVREAWQEFKNYLKLQFEGPATAVFEGLKETIEGLVPAADRVKEAYEEGGITGALEQVADEWDTIYRERLEPLWLTFLEFLND